MSNETGSQGNVLMLDSELGELERLTSFIDAFCAREGVPEEICWDLQIALEELVVNAIHHGGCDPKEGAIRLSIRKDGGEVKAVLCDSGIPFNPLEEPPPDLAGNLRERPVGGLGIHLVRNLIPSIHYERLGGRNYLYLTKPVSAGSDTPSPEENVNANGNGNHQS